MNNFHRKTVRIAQSLGAVVILIVMMSGVTVYADTETGMRVFHQLEVKLDPDEKRLVASDTMAISAARRNELTFRLSERVTDITVSIEGRRAEYEFENGLLQVPIKRIANAGTIRAKISYQGIFNDPVPVRPVNTEDPGYGVLGSISNLGTMLLSSAGWYPELLDAEATYQLTVDAPEGIIAVSAGRSLGNTTQNNRTISRWQVEYPVRGLDLAAARYVVAEQDVGGVTAATYFLPESQHLSDAYLAATARYLRLYSNLFGSYPFQKFAVVENFFPTGYGFPSFTLLGSRVLRLPFIIHTSLGHEIAHCWWGNGVYVDPESGNWSEGLTTYVADYLYKERKSEAAAREYRQQMLRNYTILVGDSDDFPLSQFSSRIDPVTKSIGYDKSAMVFHMIRHEIGDAAFWDALRTLYKERLFATASWEDIRRVFEKHGKASLWTFFRQWVYGTGAPKLALADVRKSDAGNAWKVSGKIVQQGALFDLSVPIVLETGAGKLTQNLPVKGNETKFTFQSKASPKRIVIDPESDLFRRLFSEEIPPSVNALKGSDHVLVILSEGTPKKAVEAADILARSLGLKYFRIVKESELAPKQFNKQDILILGYPSSNDLLVYLPDGVSIERDKINLYGEFHTGDDIVFFSVFRHPQTEGRVTAVLHPLSGRYLKRAIGKITHYGRYSYLLFQNERVKLKGIWPVTDSPAIYTWRNAE